MIYIVIKEYENPFVFNFYLVKYIFKEKKAL